MSFDIASAVVGTQGKGNGIGDVEVLSPANLATIIGNRLWQDTDGDGVQDADEPGIAGVTITLDVNGSKVSTVTASDDPATPWDETGEWFFSNVNGGNAEGVLVEGVVSTISVDLADPDLGSYRAVTTGGSALNDLHDNDASASGEITYTLSENGQNDLSMDIGLILGGSAISGTIYEDVDNDGDGDIVINVATIELYEDTNGDGIPDGIAIASVTTTDGTYSFAGLDPGDYVVVQTQPSGYLTVTDLDSLTDAVSDDQPNSSQTDNQIPVSLLSGELDQGNDFVEEAEVTIGNYIWYDQNMDGIQDFGETGLKNVRVRLYDSADGTGSSIASKLTSVLGYYEFTGLAPGTYSIIVEAPAGWVLSPVNVGSDDSVDSDGVATATEERFLIGSIVVTGDDDSLDVGIYHANCSPQDLQTGDIAITDSNVRWSRPSAYDFRIGHLNASGYCAEKSDGDPLNGDVMSVHDTDRNGLTSARREYIERALSALGDPDVNNEIAAWFPSGDHNRIDQIMALVVWYYTHWNETFSSVESQIDGRSWTVDQKAAMKALAQLIIDRAEGANGQTQYPRGETFWFHNETNSGRQDIVVPLSLVIPDGDCEDAFDNDNDGNEYDYGDLPQGGSKDFPTSSASSGARHVLGSGLTLGSSVDAENDGQPSLTATGDGADEDGFTLPKLQLGETYNVPFEAAVPRTVTAPVYLNAWIDYDCSGTFDAGEQVATDLVVTDGANTLTFTVPADAVPGQAYSRFRLSTDSGLTATGDASDGEVEDYLVTILPSSGVIGNYVWLDENSDGAQDPGEPGIPNVVVNLLFDADGAGGNAPIVVQTTQTDSQGGYLFTGLAPGCYYVDIDDNSLPTGYTQTTVITKSIDGADLDSDLDDGDFGNKAHSGDGYKITLDPNETNLTADFGYNVNPTDDVNNGTNEGAIGDKIWFDVDQDGRKDASEVGIVGVSVELTSAGADNLFGTADDVVVGTATTDANGCYLFDGLTPDAYVVTVTDTGGVLTGLSQTGDPDHFGTTGANNDGATTVPVVLGSGDVFLNSLLKNQRGMCYTLPRHV